MHEYSAILMMKRYFTVKNTRLLMTIYSVSLLCKIEYLTVIICANMQLICGKVFTMFFSGQ